MYDMEVIRVLASFISLARVEAEAVCEKCWDEGKKQEMLDRFASVISARNCEYQAWVQRSEHEMYRGQGQGLFKFKVSRFGRIRIVADK